MMLVVTYDVDTSDSAGQKRLRKVAKICERHGMRVQNSVFEVLVDAAQLVVLKQELGKAIDMEQDSVRFYRLGNSYENRIESMGRKPLVEAGSALIFNANPCRTHFCGRLAHEIHARYTAFGSLLGKPKEARHKTVSSFGNLPQNLMTDLWKIAVALPQGRE